MDSLYFTCLDKEFSPELLFKSAIPPNESLLEKIEILFSTAKQANHMKNRKRCSSTHTNHGAKMMMT